MGSRVVNTGAATATESLAEEGGASHGVKMGSRGVNTGSLGVVIESRGVEPKSLGEIIESLFVEAPLLVTLVDSEENGSESMDVGLRGSRDSNQLLTVNTVLGLGSSSGGTSSFKLLT
jgi:hypothetical protein